MNDNLIFKIHNLLIISYLKQSRIKDSFQNYPYIKFS